MGGTGGCVSGTGFGRLLGVLNGVIRAVGVRVEVSLWRALLEGTATSLLKVWLVPAALRAWQLLAVRPNIKLPAISRYLGFIKNRTLLLHNTKLQDWFIKSY
jgi:hypothetical protein